MPPATRPQSGAAPVSQAWAGPQSPCLPPGLWFWGPQAAAQHCPAPQHCPHFAPPPAQGQEEAAQEGARIWMACDPGKVRGIHWCLRSTHWCPGWPGAGWGWGFRPGQPTGIVSPAVLTLPLPRKGALAFLGLGVQPQAQLLREATPALPHPGGFQVYPGNIARLLPAPLPAGRLGLPLPGPPEPGGAAGHCPCQLGNKSHCPAVNLTMLPSTWPSRKSS